MVKSFGDEQYCGCTGCPADSHQVLWLTVRPSPHPSFHLNPFIPPSPIFTHPPIAFSFSTQNLTENPHRHPATVPSSDVPNAVVSTRWNMWGPRMTHKRTMMMAIITTKSPRRLRIMLGLSIGGIELNCDWVGRSGGWCLRGLRGISC